ncbi:MAG: hypothetical protein NVS4B11_14590 [Ktedonobacteraceae bacterium]
MSHVFVVDTMYTPLDPVHPGYARKLLSSGKAAVYRQFPFTIILTSEVENPHTTPLRLKLDPGSKTTGIAIVNDASGEIVWAAELQHRGQEVKKALNSRRSVRRGRRQRNTRYRQARFDNRRRKQGWLPPSLESRLANILTWVNRLSRLCPITAISQELVKFDTQLMQDAEITGMQYQQGELAGYEVREYMLDKWDRTCAYCGVTNVPLQIEHICPCAKHGSNRVSNLTLACEPCNTKKGTHDIQNFLHNKPDVLKRILAQAQAPLRDASAVNSTRWALYERLQATGLPVERGTGGRTKFNRTKQRLDKAHWIDAACVGKSTPNVLLVERVIPLLITSEGHGSRQMCLMNRFGFARTKPKARQKSYLGFQTGDIVKAIVPSGKYAGTHEGRIAIRFRPSFHLNDFDVHPKCLTVVHRHDGYSYTKSVSHFSLSLKA